MLGARLMQEHPRRVVQLTIGAEPQFPISSEMYSLFLETEINLGGEGGLYAELVRNRDFEALGRGCVEECSNVRPWLLPPMEASGGRDPHEPAELPNDYRPWVGVGDAELHIDRSTAPFASNPHSLRVECAIGAGVSNPGYFGIGVSSTLTYRLKLYGRTVGAPLRLIARLIEDGRVLAVSRLVIVPDDAGLEDNWAAYEAMLRPTYNATKAAALELLVADDGQPHSTFWLDSVSLFPSDAVGGLFRRDLFEKLYALRPGFVRCPGGNYLEGHGPRTRWDWKKTLGLSAARAGHYNSAWGYWVTDGLGLYELLKLCELLDAPCQLSVYTGYSIKATYVVLDDSDAFAQDALDMLDFANSAPHTTALARVREMMGHAAPFGLHRLEIGNEERILTRDGYAGHYDMITSRLWATDPRLKIVAAGRWRGPVTEAEDPGSPCRLGMRCDMLDQHFYQTADQMAAMGGQYDEYDRRGPKVYVGEFAANEPTGTNADGALLAHATLRAALAESVFMLGFERNADVVVASSLAPVLNNVRGTQWAHNLINFNATRVFCSPSYYALKMLAHSRGTHSLSMALGHASVPSEESSWPSDSSWSAAASLSEDAHVLIVKLVNYDAHDRTVNVSLVPWAPRVAVAIRSAQILTGQPDTENTLDNPRAVDVAAASTPIILRAGLVIGLPAWSLVVVHIEMG